VWAYTYATESEQWMHVPEIASFRFGSRSDEALVVPERQSHPIRPDVIQDAFQRLVLPMALHACGREVIHASAVIVPRGVVAFCGPSQSGKSTVAYGLHRRHGHPVWADDSLVFAVSTDRAVAVPYPHRLRIRKEAANYFNLLELRKRDTSSWTALEQAQEEPAPLACLFLLERHRTGDPVETLPLSPGQAFASVIGNAYSFRPSDPERKRSMVESYLTLVRHVPVFRLRFESTLDHLSTMLDCVESALDDVTAGR